MKSNIALIGFMGSGKSTVGKRLARRLDREFIELDRLIEQQAGKTISEIFRERGEGGFRDLEEEIIKEVGETAHNAIIACGGGAVLRPANIERLRETSDIIYLQTDTTTLQNRLAKSRNRPLLNRPDRETVIEELHDARHPQYEAAADIIIKTGRRPFASVINEIIEKLGTDESHNR
jgi:shikimate kinase